MSYGQTPGGEQEDPAGGFGGPPPYPGQAGTGAGATGGWEPGQQAPPGYGQPGYGQAPYGQPGYGSPGAPPPAYRGLGVIASICGVLFNLILGLPTALVGRRYGKKVTELWARGDVQGAIGASRKARAWLIASIVLDVLGLILTVVVIAQSSSQGAFTHPSAVAASIKTQLQQRLSDKSSQYYQPGVTVTSVVCTASGTKTDHCVDTFSNGQTGTETAVISGNGASYSTR